MQVTPTSNSVSAVTDTRDRHPDHSLDLTRLEIDYLLNPVEANQAELEAAQDVVNGLRQPQKTLPPRYFYDDRGSELFEQICNLPEYYLTRSETAIFNTCAEAIAQITGACELVELGSGSATKTRILLNAYQAQGHPLRYLPIDVSAGILESSARDLLADYPSLTVQGLVSTYQLALERLVPAQLPTRMICFIGSTLGNLDPHACDRFFSQITRALQPGEYFLLGVDLQKPKEVLEAAYNDNQGVTAEFNLNMLRHLNRRFDGNFDLTQFEHWSVYNESQHQIEMRLRSLTAQQVELRALDLQVEFRPGETILSEISRKFDLDVLQHDLKTRGLVPIQSWTDPNHWFGVLLCQLPLKDAA
ncbi:L-histidine N(alpha)-methyltransferase [Oculatella sp. LEGE 06141]|uniref:L-histidine N(alpha)-methyltransferase n=1 Tax=Oculatella sp. LEGE 06141 TaxID=1828648 RepID=UPI0018802BE2|nr:L-histidine N(alpha)-methyltransferase [Oculatella sp. LEGE 06141]MBE9179242.1 L-histidine N(alpha)-methyltransferase [Oculatella sp. LEGE 06141]